MRVAAMRGAYVIRCAEGAYVGGSVHISARWAQHRYRLRRGKHSNPHLQEAWSRLGAAAFVFEALELCGEDDLLAVEQRWIDRLKVEGFLFNLQLVAGSSAGLAHTPETRAKMAAAHRGKVFSSERCANISAAKRGSKSGSAKLTEAAVREILRRAQAGEPRRAIAAEYGISKGAVHDIVNGRTWSHLSAVNDNGDSIRQADRNDPTPPAVMARAA